MLLKALNVFCLFLFFLLSIVTSVFADTEYWSTETIQKTINSEWKFNIIPELRFKSNADGFYYLQTYIGPTYVINKTTSINLFYAQKNTKSGGQWSATNLGYLDLNYNPAPIALRLRYETDPASSSTKVRGQAQLKWLNWYVGDEVFYNMNRSYLDENRLFAGYTNAILNNDVSYAFGYLNRSQRVSIDSAWIYTDVVVLNFNVKI